MNNGNEKNTRTNRRRIFQLGFSALAALPALRAVSVFAKDSCPNKAPESKVAKARRIKEGKGRAVAFDYVEHYVDAKKHKKFKKGSKCSNCRFYRDANSKEPGKSWAPCTMLSMKYVPACGWCNKYNRDPKKM